MNNNKLELIIYISAALLAVGVFLPLTELPVYGEVTYNKVASIESYLVILFAISGIALLYLGKIKELKFAPIGVWITLLFPAIKSMFQSKDESLLSSITDKASSVMQDFAADLFTNIFEFSWGGAIFMLALLAFTASSVMRSIK